MAGFFGYPVNRLAFTGGSVVRARQRTFYLDVEWKRQRENATDRFPRRWSLDDEIVYACAAVPCQPVTSDNVTKSNEKPGARVTTYARMEASEILPKPLFSFRAVDQTAHW